MKGCAALHHINLTSLTSIPPMSCTSSKVYMWGALTCVGSLNSIPENSKSDRCTQSCIPIKIVSQPLSTSDVGEPAEAPTLEKKTSISAPPNASAPPHRHNSTLSACLQGAMMLRLPVLQFVSSLPTCKGAACSWSASDFPCGSQCCET